VCCSREGSAGAGLDFVSCNYNSRRAGKERLSPVRSASEIARQWMQLSQLTWQTTGRVLRARHVLLQSLGAARHSEVPRLLWAVARPRPEPAGMEVAATSILQCGDSADTPAPLDSLQGTSGVRHHPKVPAGTGWQPKPTQPLATTLIDGIALGEAQLLQRPAICSPVSLLQW